MFKEYHQFTDKEFKDLNKNCLFVFDTNTLLNMYRYSRKTVDNVFELLNKLKKQNQLWIPYQVGYEFYQNRINVISEYEKSYDEILLILDKAKDEIENKYKDHPFLNLSSLKEEMNSGLSVVEQKIKQAKSVHPKWLEKDDVLEKINNLFDNNIGDSYSLERLAKITNEGRERYEKKIPPGFKDDKKFEDKKYGDLIIWYQIIDKAKETGKSIILISGDTKEDWWLEKDGKRLMPLPQLKKEIFDKASVYFHIYTPDRFFELNKSDEANGDNDIKDTIKEIRKIRELEEKRSFIKNEILNEKEASYYSRKLRTRYLIDFDNLFNSLQGLVVEISDLKINNSYKMRLEHLLHKFYDLKKLFLHGNMYESLYIDRFGEFTKELSYVLNEIIHLDDINLSSVFKFREYVDRLEHINRKLNQYK